MSKDRPIIDYEGHEPQPARAGDIIAILLLVAPFLLFVGLLVVGYFLGPR